MKKIAIIPILILLLAGCAPAATEASSTPTPTATPTPTIEAATAEQVASVIAEYETAWREVIDGAVECRMTWAIDKDPTAEIRGMSCYLQEQTIGISAQLVMRDWGELVIPSSMKSLVDDTSKVLELIADPDLKSVCGEDAVPAKTDECNAALGSRNFAYSLLESKLDAWKPYL